MFAAMQHGRRPALCKMKKIEARGEMTQTESMLGMWIVRGDGAGDALLARVQEELYVLAFSSAIRASRCRDALGAEGRPFFIVAANVREVVAQQREAGARGFILDYDPARAAFSAAHALPSHDEAVAAR